MILSFIHLFFIVKQYTISEETLKFFSDSICSISPIDLQYIVMLNKGTLKSNKT